MSLQRRSRRFRGSVWACALSAALLAGVVLPAGAIDPEGSLDTGFGISGRVVTPIGTSTDVANAVVIQPDGKIVVAGYHFNGANLDFAVARYNPSGTLDGSFSGDGKTTTPIGTSNDSASAVGIQLDGKIVVAGNSRNGTDDNFAVVRYKPNGSLDTSFSGDGKTTTDVISVSETATSVGIRPDGKIVVAGYSGGGNSDFAVVRYNANGSLDAGFSGDGKTTTPIGTGHDFANALGVQPDGKTVVAGSSFSVTTDFALVRYNANGSLDASFSGDGKATTPIGTSSDDSTAIAIQPDGRIVATGYSFIGANYDFAVARYHPDGILDTSFSGDGKTTTPIGTGEDVAGGMGVQPDGKIVVAGNSDNGANTDFAVARFNSDGSLDASFSGDGKTTTAIGADNDFANALALQGNGRIVVAGNGFNGTDFDFALVRYVGDATPPHGAHLVGLPRYSLSLTRRLFWTASDDNTGIQSYDVRRRSARYDASSFGPYSGFKSKTPYPTANFTGTRGRTYCFDVRGRDMAGNVGPYGVDGCTAIPVDERTMTRTGTWTPFNDPGFYGGTVLVSSTAGSTLQLPVDYRHLAVVATRCSGCGTIKIYLGNALLKTVNLGTGAANKKVVIPVASSGAVKSGTVKITQASAGKNVFIEGLAVSLA